MLLVILILRLCLDVMTWQAPGRDHTELAWANAVAIAEVPPLFKNDDDHAMTTALVLAVEYRESGFKNAASSRTDDHCAMQINRRPDLKDDPLECVRVGIAMLRESMRACPDAPIAFYAEGPKGCESERARAISRDRMNLARFFLRKARP
jgi:hypothetical protein